MLHQNRKGQMGIRVFVAASILLFASASPAQVGGIDVELNKLESVDNACRAYLVTQNLTDVGFETLQMDIVMFDKNGIVAKRLAVEIAPMPPGKTSLKVFDIAGLACDQIGQLLLNDVIQCRDTDGVRHDCLSLLKVTSRGAVPFIN